MNAELDKALCDKYPKIFRDRRGDMMTTAMCWGFECGDGWYNIIDTLCCEIQGHIDSSVRVCAVTGAAPLDQVVATQVKEKYGTLRFYTASHDDTVEGMINMAEAISGSTCDVCGSPGRLTGKGWLSTRCEEHEGETWYDVIDELAKISKPYYKLKEES
jgi:hypothetical protein